MKELALAGPGLPSLGSCVRIWWAGGGLIYYLGIVLRTLLDLTWLLLCSEAFIYPNTKCSPLYLNGFGRASEFLREFRKGLVFPSSDFLFQDQHLAYGGPFPHNKSPRLSLGIEKTSLPVSLIVSLDPKAHFIGVNTVAIFSDTAPGQLMI